MSNLRPSVALVVLCLFAGVGTPPAHGRQAPASLPSANPPSQVSSPQAGGDLVVERLDTRVRLETDGTGERRVSVRVRVLTDAAVQQLSQVSVQYDSSLGTARFDRVEVRKPSGQTARSSPEAIRDVAVQALPQVFTDLHDLRAVVPALGAGDTLAYDVTVTTTHPQIEGQFWFEHRFTTNQVMEEESVTLDLPAARSVRLKTAPGFEPIVGKGEASGERRVYRWRKSNPTVIPVTVAAQKAAEGRLDPPAIQATTFASWNEFGGWYLQALEGRDLPDTTVRAKAEELTAGLATPRERLQALYDFVATQCRYVSLSFASGLLVPHAASEVLANRYGDCKDRHTLLSALARAVGLRTSAALVSSVQELDPDLPSPGQFNHMITVAALGPTEGDWVWLDTSAGVAPFGLLVRQLRGKRALLLSDPGSSAAGTDADRRIRVATTPPAAPFPCFGRLHVSGSLDELGALDARVRTEQRGDFEVALRTVFRLLPSDEQRRVIEKVASGLELGTAVTEDRVSDPVATRTPFAIEFRARKEAWFDRSKAGPLALPLDTMTLERTTEDEWRDQPAMRLQPAEYEALVTMDLPSGYRATMPVDVTLTRDYARYQSTYRLDGSRLTVRRVLTANLAELGAERMRDYLAFVNAVRADEAQKVRLDASGARPAAVPATAGPSELFAAGQIAYDKSDYKSALDLWKRASDLAPQHKSVWNAIGLAQIKLQQWEEAVTALQQQVKVNPYHEEAWGNLGYALDHTSRREDARAAYRQQIQLAPLDKQAHRRLGISLLKKPVDYREAATELAKADQITPDVAQVVRGLGDALLQVGETEKALDAYRRVRKLDASPGVLSEMAGNLADVGVALDVAIEWARAAIESAAAESLAVDITRVRPEDARRSWALSWGWHALGWASFLKGDLTTAERYLLAARSVRSSAAISFRLGQVVEKLGRPQEALRYYAEASTHADGQAARPYVVRLAGSEKSADEARIKASYTLIRERTSDIARASPKGGRLDFVAVFTNGSGRPEVRADGTNTDLEPLLEHVRSAAFPVRFPDGTPARVVTNGVLVCADAGGDCGTLLLFGSTAPGRK